MHTRNVQESFVGRGGEEQRESRASLCSDVLATQSSVNTDGDAGAPLRSAFRQTQVTQSL